MTSKRFPFGSTWATMVRLSRWFYLLVALAWLATLAVALSTGEGSVARPALLATTFLLCAVAAHHVTCRSGVEDPGLRGARTRVGLGGPRDVCRRGRAQR